VSERCCDERCDGLDVGVFENNQRSLPAQFRTDPFQRLCALLLGDLPANPGAAGVVDDIDVGGFDHRRRTLISSLRDEHTRLEPVDRPEASLRISIDANFGPTLPAHPTAFGMLQRGAKGLEQHFVAKGFAQECDGAGLHCLPSLFCAVVSSDENDRNLVARGGEMALEL
jgi:hypothetical protein